MKKQLSIWVSILIFFIFIPQCFWSKTNDEKAAAMPNKVFSLNAAFDGSSYLLAIRGDVSSSNNVTAQFMDTSGNLTGSRLSITGYTKGIPIVFFDNTNYLLIWDHVLEGGANPPVVYIYGQFISKSGINIGSPFIIAEVTGNNGEEPPGLIGGVFDGINYFIAWNTAGSGDMINGSDLYGRFISPAGSLLGSEIAITTADYQQRDATVGFDGTNILVVWADGGLNNPPSDIFGRFITKSGSGTPGALSGPIFIINENDNASDNPISIAFDDSNYMVVWMDELSDTNWDLFGQLIDQSGNQVGGVISVNTAVGMQFWPLIAFDGTNYLVTWTDMRNDSDSDGICDSGEGTGWDIHGQYIGTNGSLVGTEFVINNDTGNQLGGVLGFNNAKYLIMVNTGVTWELVDGTFFADFVTP